MKSATFSTSTTNTTQSPATTKSKENILIQSSGAMIAVIVIGIIIILTILLIILKTYHRCTKTSRVLRGGPKSRTKSSSTVHTNMHFGPRGPNSQSSSVAQARSTMGNGFQLPRAEVPNHAQNSMEQLSTISDSTVVTIHNAPPLENT
ncbi:noncompact myelin-associated protein [Anguilla rostrata]|uniref:noncompact myelin-associated protein n=1 Tax=Anguilla rostrata TaxID=7938 RepID=UPI0030CB2CC0